MSSGDMSAVQPGKTLLSPSSTYSVLEFIGEGCFGKVAKCRKLPTKEIVAVKIMKKKTRHLNKEMSILSIISVLNPDVSNVVKFFECFTHKGLTCLAFEMLERDLHYLLEDRDWESLSLKEIRPIAKQMLVALDALKGLGILHTDIKPDNIMVVNTQERPLRVKLIDFGVAITTSQVRTGLEIQPTGYRAPEIALGLPFTEAIDVWGIGCVLAFLFLAENFFPSCRYQMMKCLVEVLGQPEDHQLRAGIYTKRFFVKEKSTKGPAWRLMTAKEFTAANIWEAQEFDSTVELPSSLDELVDLYENDEDADLQDSRAFVDLLKGLLHLDGDQRISPQRALQLPFITMSHLQEHPDSREYLTTSEAMSCKPQLPKDEDPDPCTSDEDKPSPLHDEDPDPRTSDEDKPSPLHDEDPDPCTYDEDKPSPLHDEDPDPRTSDEDKPSPLHDEGPDPRTSDEDKPSPLHNKDTDPCTYDEDKPSPLHDEDPDPRTSDEDKPSPLHDEDPDPRTSDEDKPSPLHDEDPDPRTSDEDKPSPLHDEDPGSGASDEDKSTPLHDEDPDPRTSDEDKPSPLHDEDTVSWYSDEYRVSPLPDEDTDPWSFDEDKPSPLHDEDTDPWSSDEDEPSPLHDEDPDPWASDEDKPSPLHDEDTVSWYSDEYRVSPLPDEDTDPWSFDEDKPSPLHDEDTDPWSSDEDEPSPLHDEDPDPWASDEDEPSPLHDVDPDPWASDGEIPPEVNDEDPNQPPSASSGSSKRFKRIRRFFRRIKDIFCCCCRAED